MHKFSEAPPPPKVPPQELDGVHGWYQYFDLMMMHPLQEFPTASQLLFQDHAAAAASAGALEDHACPLDHLLYELI